MLVYILMNANTLLEKIYGKEWHFYVTRKFNWFVENTQILANETSTLVRFIGLDISQENYLILNGDEYYTDSETSKYSLTFENVLAKDPSFLDTFVKKTFKIASDVNNYTDELKIIDVRNITANKLAEIISSFQEMYTMSFVPASSRPDAYLEAKIKKLIQSSMRASEKKVNEIFSIIATYPKLGELAYADEPLELLYIAQSIKKSGYTLDNLPNDLYKKLANHVSKYSWMKGSIFIEDISFTREEYLERLENLMSKNIDEEISRIVTIRKTDQAKYKKLSKTFTQKLKNIADILRSFIFLRTYTTEASDRLLFFARATILREAAQRLRFSPEEITMLSSDEIVALLLNKRQQKDLEILINERMKGYAIVIINDNVTTTFGEQAELLQHTVADKYKGNSVVDKSEKRQRVIKGTPASLGTAQGVVKVLTDYREVEKVDRGDILVASMTTPDFIVAMEKSAAFITDEGGVTCHAAIIAREFGVPCIVGTGNATTLLKDGDIVEIDAKKGLVTLIKPVQTN